jgi:hypothetical protein
LVEYLVLPLFLFIRLEGHGAGQREVSSSVINAAKTTSNVCPLIPSFVGPPLSFPTREIIPTVSVHIPAQYPHDPHELTLIAKCMQGGFNCGKLAREN